MSGMAFLVTLRTYYEPVTTTEVMSPSRPSLSSNYMPAWVRSTSRHRISRIALPRHSSWWRITNVRLNSRMRNGSYSTTRYGACDEPHPGG